MFLNVWLVIWPQQKIVCGIASGDIAVASAKALLVSRTNTLLSAPMLFGMLASKHGPPGGGFESFGSQLATFDAGFVISLLIVVIVEVNGLFGKLRWIATIASVIGWSLALTALLYLILHFL